MTRHVTVTRVLIYFFIHCHPITQLHLLIILDSNFRIFLMISKDMIQSFEIQRVKTISSKTLNSKLSPSFDDSTGSYINNMNNLHINTETVLKTSYQKFRKAGVAFRLLNLFSSSQYINCAEVLLFLLYKLVLFSNLGIWEGLQFHNSLNK